jgi:hypothetical protein
MVPGPAALDHLRDVGLLLLLRAVHEERRDRAHGEAGIHGERHVRGGRELVHDHAERVGQALSAIFLRHGQPDPAALAIGLVGLLETRGRRDRAVRVALAALDVADAIERLEHLLAELGALGQDRLDHVGGRVGEAGKVVVLLELEDVVQQEQRVVDGRLVARHEGLSPEILTGLAPVRADAGDRPASR